MRASLIICTRNRGTHFTASLDYLSRLETPRGGHELILVDNGSSDSTPDLIRAFVGSVRYPVIALRQPIPGHARARNTGLARASGEICVFTDDDCYLRPDFLIQMSSVLEDTSVGYVGGRITLHDPTDAPLTIKDEGSPEIFTPRRFLPPGIVHGANMAARREVITEIGGFDPLFGPGTPRSGDDIEFLSRACWAGWAGRYDPRPVVAHHHRRKPGAVAARHLRYYQFGRGAYYMKRALNPDSRRVYLRAWRDTNRDYLRARNLRAPIRVVAGALNYLLARVGPHEAIPRI